MSALKDSAFEAFPTNDLPQLTSDIYDEKHFGSGIVEYKYKNLFVRIINDRGQLFCDIGLIPVKLEPLPNIGNINTISAKDVSEYILKHYAQIEKTLATLPRLPDN
jgi:hypothetical protein